MSDRESARAPSPREEIEAGISSFSRILAKMDQSDRQQLGALIAQGPPDKELSRFLEQAAIRSGAAIPREALDEYRRLTTAPDAMEFVLPALLEGEWFALEQRALRRLHQASGALKHFTGDMPQFRKGRMKHLPSLAQTLLYEIEVEYDAATGLVYLVHGPDYLGLAKGGSDVLFRLHERAGQPALDTPEQALDYLEVFCSLVRGAEGRFRIVKFDQPGWALIAAKHAIAEGFGRPVITRLGEREWQVHAIVHYADMLFEADFRIRGGGMVEMMDDVPIGPHAPIELWREPFRLPAEPQVQAPPDGQPPDEPGPDKGETTQDKSEA